MITLNVNNNVVSNIQSKVGKRRQICDAAAAADNG